MSKPYVGDVGTIIRVDVGVNLFNVIINDDPQPRFEVTKPGGTVVVWPATVEGAPISGILFYEVTDDDFDVEGEYKLQPIIKFADGSHAGGYDVWHGETRSFFVNARFK
jgi:hypothetical protein